MQFDYINKWHRIRQTILISEYVYVKTLYTLSQ